MEKLGEKEARKKRGELTLPYSHRNPERGIAISCNGLWITLSINAFTFLGCTTIVKNKTIDASEDKNDHKKYN